jgi:hypothetical protein
LGAHFLQGAEPHCNMPSEVAGRWSAPEVTRSTNAPVATVPPSPFSAHRDHRGDRTPPRLLADWARAFGRRERHVTATLRSRFVANRHDGVAQAALP